MHLLIKVYNVNVLLIIGSVGKDCSSLVKTKNQFINYRVVYAPGTLVVKGPLHNEFPHTGAVLCSALQYSLA